MKNYLLAHRYASALLLSIEDDGDLDPARDALHAAAGLFSGNPALHSALATPSTDVDRRAAVLREVLGEETPPLVRRLAEILLRRGRISLLPDVAAVFSTVADRRLNRVTAEVATAVPLEEQHRARLNEALAKFSGKTVRMECAVDPELLGGAVARLDGTLLDGSVRSRLKRLRAALLAEEN
jgi:F-type H+-transporting ATPase subunit delta